MNTTELLAFATTFMVQWRDPYTGYDQITVEARARNVGPHRWAICKNGNCLTKDGEWVYESLPSSRTDEFLVECRWDDLDEAITAAKKAAEKNRQMYDNMRADMEKRRTRL
jgi:hypothetical protein